MRAELVPMDGGPPIPIVRDITVIGRREFCDVQLDDPSLSKRHCVVVKTDGLLMIRDLASTNGTRVKGQLIRWAALLPNDRIALGKLKFRVFLGPSEPDPRPQADAKEPRRDHAAGHPGGAVPTSPPRAVDPAFARAEPSAPVAALPESDDDDSDWLERVVPLDDDDVIIDLE